MEIEQLEIRDYLAQCVPLNKLSSDILDQIIRHIEITYIRRGEMFLSPDKINQSVYLLRTGAIEITRPSGELYGCFTEGHWVGHHSVIRGGQVKCAVTASEDSLLYVLPRDYFLNLLTQYPDLNIYFSSTGVERLQNVLNDFRGNGEMTLVSSQIGDLAHGQSVFVEHTVSIREAAQRMKNTPVRSILITREGAVCGIVTDRAFCTLVAATGRNIDDPIREIMTPKPITVSTKTPATQALLLMLNKNIGHLPLTANGKVVSMVTAADLIRRQNHNALYLVNEIHRANSIEELQALSQHIPKTLVTLVESSLSAYDTGHVISTIGQSISQRLLKMAEAQFGAPPIPYAWVAAGSLARNEQTAHSDQDNALIIDDSYDEKEHGEYFIKLAQFVSDGLNACGYVYCPGNVMATNPIWRQPLSQWKRYFSAWIHKPEHKALMHSSIFFDLRCFHGDASLLQRLRDETLAATKGNTIFLAYMAANALQFHPPLGLFRHFVLEKGGEEKKALNMKKRGVVPVTDLARVYTLSAGVEALHTQDRLEASYNAGALSQSGMADLRDAFEFISTVRLQHQLIQIKRGSSPDNFVPPEQLSSLEQRHLKDAFEIVRTIQAAMAGRYQTGRFA